ncbi:MULTISPECIES: C40 family peptidase [Thermomonosporaceae]|uniref:C40 family peptidase n=1 Tax=Thermomonosporaceae TaxID=2012 RepID=UPI00255B089D|nr:MULTISPECIES: C40 family peptidase [Thermomonosporaceae]MDL4772927.1 C40 family peptidase [Actinomadura xylanilytica]
MTAAALGATLLVAAPAHATAAVPQAAPQTANVASTVAAARISKARATKQKKRANYAIKYASKQIGDRYRYGGTGPGSWDCSGLAGGSWRKAGVKLPRTTQQIYKKVKYRVSWKGAVKGDLLFFYSGKTHMGVYIGKGYMIHAPSSGKRVKKVKLNRYYKRNFAGAVRPGY